MKTIVKFLILLVVVNFGLISCDKEKHQEPEYPEDSKPRWSAVYRYDADKVDGKTLLEGQEATILELSIGIVGGQSFEEDAEGNIVRLDWFKEGDPFSIVFLRIGNNLDKIDGYELCLKENPSYLLSKEYDIRQVSFDEKTLSFSFKPHKSVSTDFRILDIQAIKYDYEQDCLFVTLKTPLRDTEKSPATYRLDRDLFPSKKR